MKMMFRIILYLILPSAVVKTSMAYIPLATFEHQITLDNCTCAVGDTVFSQVLVRSKIQCALTCMKLSTCYTVFYNSSARTCSGCNGVYGAHSLPPTSTGNIHYQIYPCKYIFVVICCVQKYQSIFTAIIEWLYLFVDVWPPWSRGYGWLKITCRSPLYVTDGSVVQR